MLVVGLLPAKAVAQVQWKMTTEYPESNISGIGLVTFGKLLSSKTQGALTTVTAFDNEMKISSREMPQAAQDHRIDGGDAFAAPLESSDPIFGLSALPFVVQSVETAKAVNAKARPLYERALAARGMKLLYVTIWPATGIWSDQPIKGEEDLHALAVRAYDKSSAEVLHAAGAAAEFLPFNEAIAKVREHKLNAILTSGDGGAGRKLWDDLHHFTPINYAIPVSIAFIRKDAFDALSADQQAAVDAAAAETEKQPDRTACQPHRRELCADARQRRQHRRAGAAGHCRRPEESRRRSDRGVAGKSFSGGGRHSGLGQRAVADAYLPNFSCSAGNSRSGLNGWL